VQSQGGFGNILCPTPSGARGVKGLEQFRAVFRQTMQGLQAPSQLIGVNLVRHCEQAFEDA
jgi:hypothetical protein